jgi:hypothetical protein
VNHESVEERKMVMGDGFRWAVVLAAALVLIGLAAYARGDEHYRGDEIGSHGTKVVLVRVDDE